MKKVAKSTMDRAKPLEFEGFRNKAKLNGVGCLQ